MKKNANTTSEVLAEVDQQLHSFISNLDKIKDSGSDENTATICEITSHLLAAHSLIHNNINYEKESMVNHS